ncbi:MAG TPA: aminomethyl-transferring glycine dehydrogenase subunit GcvPA [Anaerolineae bacterium]|nr:aminomethyl-transferring glycine dehydrogenase subunit GcvPA [Anaerolineae bacterium]
MTYVPLTDAGREEMLARIGVSSIGDLFADVPQQHRYPPIELPQPLSEMEVLRELRELSERNVDLEHSTSFLGAGAYQHHVPSVVQHIISRSEFYTAYTPYQAEISQGTLQATFEYQSMICALTGLEVANASHYDGATALAEGVLMAYNIRRAKRRKAILSPRIHPEYRDVVRTYTQGTEICILGDESVDADLGELIAQIDSDTCCVAIQNPDFLGKLESIDQLRALASAAHAHDALLIVVAYPIALALLQPPGAYGADIAVGEAQPLGIGLNYGGPYIGYFACRKAHVHKMAGRLVGETVDVDGQRGYVLTLSAREQHIRRERATSNICTNQALCALASAVYLSALGRTGLRAVAELCYHKAHYLASRIDALEGYELATRSPFFNEFVIRCPRPASEINAALLSAGIIGGFDLSRFDPRREAEMLLCTTEVHSRQMLDRLVHALEEAR